jgi:selT/selW/selH-like putative selenoprotein
LLLKGVLGDEFPGIQLIKDDMLTKPGEFNVVVGDEVIFSKSVRTRYPEPNEIIEILLKMQYEPRKRKQPSN